METCFRNLSSLLSLARDVAHVYVISNDVCFQDFLRPSLLFSLKGLSSNFRIVFSVVFCENWDKKNISLKKFLKFAYIRDSFLGNQFMFIVCLNFSYKKGQRQ